MRKKLTDRLVESLKPKSQSYEVIDSEISRLRLRVTPNGVKSFALRYSDKSGCRKRQHIGRYPIISAEEARRQAVTILQDVMQNEAPVVVSEKPQEVANHHIGDYPIISAEQARMCVAMLLQSLMQGATPIVSAGKSEVEPVSGMTFAELCDEYMEFGVSHKSERTIKLDAGRVLRHIKPLLGDVLIAEFTRSDFEKFVRDIEGGKTAVTEKTRARGKAVVTGGSAVARSAGGLVSAILSYAVRKEYIDKNVAFGVRLPVTKKVERFLNPQEFGKLGSELGKEKYSLHARNIIRLLLLTGCRRDEIAGLQWEFIDLERKCLRLPRTKTGARLVALGETAVEFIKTLPRDHATFVFPNSKGTDYFGATSSTWRKMRKNIGLQDCRVHDFRHTFASIAAQLGYSMETIGALLGHSSGGTTSRYIHFGTHTLGKAATHISKVIDGYLGGGVVG